jgi:hypothetical protein
MEIIMRLSIKLDAVFRALLTVAYLPADCVASFTAA